MSAFIESWIEDTRGGIRQQRWRSEFGQKKQKRKNKNSGRGWATAAELIEDAAGRRTLAIIGRSSSGQERKKSV